MEEFARYSGGVQKGLVSQPVVCHGVRRSLESKLTSKFRHEQLGGSGAFCQHWLNTLYLLFASLMINLAKVCVTSLFTKRDTQKNQETCPKSSSLRTVKLVFEPLVGLQILHACFQLYCLFPQFLSCWPQIPTAHISVLVHIKGCP